MDRRQFLKTALVGAAALALHPVLRSLAASRPPAPDVSAAMEPQRLRTIPKTGDRIPVMGLGTARTFNRATSTEHQAPLKEVLRLFYESGGRVVYTSPMYGEAETVLGDLAAHLGLSEDLFVATKVWIKGAARGIRQMNASFEKLRVRTIDLMQVHNLVDWKTQLKTMRAWKDAGRIRFVGLTHSRALAFDRLERLLLTEPLDFVQLNYSIAEREASRRLLPLAADQGVAILVNRPFVAGDLFQQVHGRALPKWAEEFDCASWAQFFLKYVIAHPAVTCVIPATSKPHHLVDNMQSGTGRLPEEPLRRRMLEYFLSSA